MTADRKYFLLFLLALPLYLTWTFDHSLWNPDETRDAGIAAEMYRTSNFVVPKLNQEAFLEKPPLYYWSCAVIYKLTGRITAGTTRLPSALFGFLGLLFTFLIGKHLFDSRTGLFAAGLLATATQYFRMSHFATMDVTLAAMIAGALYFYLRGSKIGFALFTVLAFYTKGFLGVALPGVVVTVDLLAQKKFKELALTIAIGAAVFAILVSPWLYALWKAGGREYLKVLIVDNNLKRFAANGTDHTESPWYVYFYSFLGDFMPWSLVFLAAAWRVTKQWNAFWIQPNRRFLARWFLSIFVLLTLSSSKRSIYLLPLFPAGALLSAALLNNVALVGPKGRVEKFSFWGSALLSSILTVAAVGAIFYFHKSVAIGCLAGAMAILTLSYFVISFRRGRFETALLLMMGLTAASVASASYSAMDKLDQDKTFLPVVQAAQKISPQGLIIGYDWSEMERGVFPFYLGETVPNFSDTETVRLYLEKCQGMKFALIANRTKKDAIESGLKDKVALVGQYRPDKKNRSYLIYETR